MTTQKLFIFVHIIFIITILYSTEGQTFDILPIKNVSNLYLERLSNHYIHCDYQEMKICFKIENYINIKGELFIALNALNSTCHRIGLDTQCEKDLNNIFILNHDINDKFIYLFRSLNNEERRRRKRSIVDLKYHDINWLNFTSIEAEYGLITLKNKINILLARILYLDNHDTNSTLNEQRSSLNSLLNYLHASLVKHLEFYDQIIKIHQNKDSNALLSLVQLQIVLRELKRLDESANKKLCGFPKVFESIDLIELLSISFMETELIGNMFTIHIKIPTIHNQLAKTYRVTPLPFEYQNKTYIIFPTSPYYITTIDSLNNVTAIYTPSSETMSMCINITLGSICNIEKVPQYIRPLNFEDNNLFSTYERCYNKSLDYLATQTSMCNLYGLNQQIELIEISENIYFLHLTNDSYVNILCLNQRKSINLKNSTILKIHSGCSIKTLNGKSPTYENKLKFNLVEAKIIKSREENNTELIFDNKYIRILCFLFIFLIIIWIATLYYTHKCTKNQNQNTSGLIDQPKTQNIDMEWKFLFKAPSLPARYFYQYDVPKSTRTILDDEIEKAQTSKIVEYATIKKKKKVSFNENVEERPISIIEIEQ